MSTEENLDHLRNVSVAVVSAIPLWGGPIAVLLDKYLPSYLERRRDEMLSQLSRDFIELSTRLSPERLSTDEFIAVFVKAFHRAMEEHIAEKREAFRAIILNTALSQDNQFDEASLYIRLVSDLTADQIKILRLLTHEEFRGEDQGLYYAIQRVWPGIDSDYLKACATELLRYNLASSNPSEVATQGHHFLTGLGHRFIEFISIPPAA